MNLVEAGLYYLKRGMSVFPFKSDKSGSLVKWEQYQKLHPSQNDVKGWFEKRFSNQFIAIATGKISNITVIDCDTQKAYEQIQEHIPESLKTPICKSPHGYHIYFKYREGLSSRRYMDNVDVKTDGGCICAPPSINGNGIGYNWLSGLSLEKNEIAIMPDSLYYLLIQYLNRGGMGGDYIGGENSRLQLSTPSTSVYKYLTEGRRDQDLFHIANCLMKGKCEKELASQVIKILAKNCDPPFSEKDAEIKFRSAESRNFGRERNITAEIKDWILSTSGIFLSTTVYNDLQLSTRDERKAVSIALKRLADEGVIEKSGQRNGEWRLVDQSCKPMDWINADCAYKELWLPLGLGEICGVQPGNIFVIAGAKDSGKTGFLMNIAKENRYRYKVHYFNSEMGPAEFKMRASKFDEPISLWKDVAVYERSDNFQDVIKAGEGNLNIIDFLEVVDEFWKVAATIQKIHQKLNGALCVIGLQKNPHVDLGRGGAFSLEKARLYLSLDYQAAKIVSCKNFKENDIIQGNPRGYTCKYTLANGCHIKRQPPGWISPDNSMEV